MNNKNGIKDTFSAKDIQNCDVLTTSHDDGHLCISAKGIVALTEEQAIELRDWINKQYPNK